MLFWLVPSNQVNGFHFENEKPDTPIFFCMTPGKLNKCSGRHRCRPINELKWGREGAQLGSFFYLCFINKGRWLLSRWLSIYEYHWSTLQSFCRYIQRTFRQISDFRFHQFFLWWFFIFRNYYTVEKLSSGCPSLKGFFHLKLRGSQSYWKWRSRWFYFGRSSAIRIKYTRLPYPWSTNNRFHRLWLFFMKTIVLVLEKFLWEALGLSEEVIE